MTDRRELVRGWHGVIAVLVAVSVVTQLVLVLRDDASVVNLFSYFTIQSNLLTMAAAALVAVDPERDEPWFQVLRLAALVGITVTGIVYATVLAGALDLSGLRLVLDVVFHYVVPWASVAGFVLLAPRTPLGPGSWWFLVWPVAWLAYTLVRAQLTDAGFAISDTETGPVPYDFLDVDRHGAASVAVVSVAITLLAVLLAAGYRWVASRPRRSATTSNT